MRILIIAILAHAVLWATSQSGIVTWNDSELQWRYQRYFYEQNDPVVLMRRAKWPVGILLLRAEVMKQAGWFDVRAANFIDSLALIALAILAYLHYRPTLGNLALVVPVSVSAVLIYAVKEPFLDVWFAAVSMAGIYTLGRYADRESLGRAVVAGACVALPFYTKQAAWGLFAVPVLAMSLKKWGVLILAVAAGMIYPYWHAFLSPIWGSHFSGPPLSALITPWRGEFLSITNVGNVAVWFEVLYPLPLLIFSLVGIVWAARSGGARSLDALYICPALALLTWRYGVQAIPISTRHLYPLLPVLVGGGLAWIARWKPRPLKCVALCLYLSAVLYPAAGVITDLAGVSLPDLPGTLRSPFRDVHSFSSLANPEARLEKCLIERRKK